VTISVAIRRLIRLIIIIVVVVLCRPSRNRNSINNNTDLRTLFRFD